MPKEFKKRRSAPIILRIPSAGDKSSDHISSSRHVIDVNVVQTPERITEADGGKVPGSSIDHTIEEFNQSLAIYQVMNRRKVMTKLFSSITPYSP